MKTSEVLRAAKALIGTSDKWCGTGWGESGLTYCSIAAMKAVPAMAHFSASEFVQQPAYRALADQVPTAVGIWNDWLVTTHADVMAAFDRAIAAEEAAEGSQDTFPSEWVRAEVPA